MEKNFMAHPLPFPRLPRLFTTHKQHKLQSYQLVDALIKDLHRSIDDATHSAMALDLARSIFNIQHIDRLHGPQWVNGEQFLVTYTSCLFNGSIIDLSADPFGFRNVPPDLAGPWVLEPLAGPNTACLKPQAATNFSPEQRRFILLWYNNHSQRSDVCLYIFDLEQNRVYALPTYDFWIYQDLLHIFQLTLPMPLWTDSNARANHFRSLPKADQLAHLPAPCPIHFGHYLQNNLAHLSRLEDLGVLASVNHVFRTQTFDYFLPEEEKLFLAESTRKKISIVADNQEAIKVCQASNHAILVSKSSSFGSGLSSHFRLAVPALPADQDTPIMVCVGVRGGTRMCLNLVDFAVTFAAEINRLSGRPVHLVIDGMSRSALNDKDTTAGLSTTHEQALASEIIDKASAHDGVTASSIVGLSTFQQLAQIRQCSLALSGFGTQYFKYMYLCNLPTIVHGFKEPDDYLNVGITPVHLFLGQDCVASIEKTSDAMRNHYRLKIALSTAKSVHFAEQIGALSATFTHH